jgi:hypothetical protein
MKTRTLLVGDNPFHGVSHFSQERARRRDDRILDPSWAAEIVKASFENGADGFMFSVSETTLGILRKLPQNPDRKYYAIVPAAGDYVRLSSKSGTTGLLKHVAMETLRSGNIPAITYGVRGVMQRDLSSLFKAYLAYEVSRVNSSLKRGEKPYALMLHELVTEMAVALDMGWLVRSHVEYLSRIGIKPGFETRNFVCLVDKLRELDVDLSDLVITTPFNGLGFQMNPEKAACENTLRTIPETEVIAMSVLASGRLGLPEAREYIGVLPELSGIVVGASRKEQAQETFRFFRGAI